MDDSDNEDIENLLLEQHVSAFVSGDLGSNTLDYDDLAKNDFRDLRTKKKNLEIDWGQMFTAERTNLDRDRLKNWININRREERSRRYDTILFSQLKNSEFYPERIGNLGFGFIGAPEVAYWDGIGGLIGFTPEAEERNTGERENQMEYQEEMDKEYSHLSCNFSSYQRVEKDEDEGFRVRHDKSLGTDLSAERFGWYFERTVPDDYLARAREIHGYDSNEDVGRAVYNLVTEKLEQVAEEHDLKKEGTEDLPSFEERISEELSFDNL